MAKFSEVLTIVNGRNQNQVVCDDGKYPIYGSGGIMGYANDYICKAETVVIGRKGSINKPIFVETPFWNVDTAFGLCANSEKLNPKYLYYFCEKFDFEKLNTTVTIPSLTKSNLLNVEIPLPNLEKQKQIVELLDKVTSLISLRKQQLAKLDELVKARFVEMFTANESNFPMTALNDLCKEIFAGGDKPSEMSQIQTDEFEFPVYANGYENLGLQGFAKNYRVEEKSVTISARGTIGYSFIREGRYTPIVRLITAVPGDKLNVVYLKYSIDMLDIKSSGTSQAQLTVPNFKKMKIMEPPLPLQNEFAAFVERVDQQKQAVQQSLEKLELMKKALMQEYFG